MKYELPFERTGYLPKVVATLSGLDDKESGHENLCLNHPLDVFYFTFSDVIKCVSRLTRRYEKDITKRKNSSQYKPDDIEEYSVDIFNTIFYSSNFIEACQSIIKSVCHGNKKVQTKAVREFNVSTKDYRSHISKIINEIKHKHRRVNTFSYAWDSNLIIGYYIEGVVDKGVLGPDPLIHKNFNGLRTGFSLNRYIPYYLINLYHVASCLDSVMKKYGNVGDSEFTLRENRDIVDCIEMVSRLPMALFTDEFKLKVPAISAKAGERFLLELPGKRKIENKKLHIADVSLGARVGLHSKTMTFPYFAG
ncbi:hypothetical protein EAG18_19160 [Pseudoalteromonas sp. J010]|uniref:hypothetical protein n=1 Tax=Pseudoalteromonas sp. J010 TaxID=998465 RepID=UPI000F655495|nr:hypothetical protein [Pseudoalteromonas sp. J010]RRS07066.1 hypothetical protein EAG18_19160 [Pseudoalteromonas sp. J010]